MKNLLVSLSLVAGALLVSSQSHAGVLLDPYMVYETGTSSSGSTSDDVSGTGIGARVGYSMLGLWVGADVEMITINSDGGDNKLTDMGLAAGYEFPIMLRAYASYILNSKGTFDEGSMTGTGTKIGVGYTGLPFVSINLEMITRTYDKASLDVGGELDVDSTVKTTGISVSLPLDL